MVRTNKAKDLANKKIEASPISGDSKSIKKIGGLSEQVMGSKLQNNRTPANPLASTLGGAEILKSLKHVKKQKKGTSTLSDPLYDSIPT